MRNYYLILICILATLASQYIVQTLADSDSNSGVGAEQVSNVTNSVSAAAATDAATTGAATTAAVTATASAMSSPTPLASTAASSSNDTDYLSLTNGNSSAGCTSSVVTYSFVLFSPNITHRYQYLNTNMNITWGYSNPNPKVSNVQIFYKSKSAPQNSWTLAVNASGSDRTVMWYVENIGADYYLLKLVANGKDNTVAGSTICYNEGEVQTGVTSSPVYIFPMPVLQSGNSKYMPNSGADSLRNSVRIVAAVVLAIVSALYIY